MDMKGVGAVVSHVYAEVGVYTAVVTASNDVSSMTATTTVHITATLSPPPEHKLYLPFMMRGGNGRFDRQFSTCTPYQAGL